MSSVLAGRQKAGSSLLPWFYLIAATALLYSLFSHWGYDDPFITYRYAYNLAHGQGMVYNPGERILSTTTPFFALLLAILSPLWLDLPRLANLSGALGLALGGLFLWDLARPWKTPAVGWAGLFLYPTFPLLLSTLGSETPVYLAFCLGAFAAYTRGRYAWTAAFSALALLARPDGALVPILLGADYLLRVRRPIPWRAVLVFLGLSLPWFLFAWAYFGSPFPATLAAKQQQGAMAISQRFAPGLLTVARDYVPYAQYWLEAALAVLGAGYLARRARPWTLFLAWTVLYFAAYSILGVSRYYWYYAPLVPGFVVLIGLGVAAVVRFATDRRPQTADRSQAAAEARSLTSTTGGWRSAVGGRLKSFLPLLLILPLALAQGSNLLQLRQHSDPRVPVYRIIGQWIDANAAPDATVGALEVGIIGYYARRPMVDFAGLIQPEVAGRLTSGKTYEDAALWAVDRYQPDYLVLHDENFPRLEQGYAAQTCRIVQRFPRQPGGYSADLTIYACR